MVRMTGDSKDSIESIKKMRGSNIVNVRVPLGLISNIDDWVESKEFKSKSEFIVAAIRHYLDYLTFREDYSRNNLSKDKRKNMTPSPSEDED